MDRRHPQIIRPVKGRAKFANVLLILSGGGISAVLVRSRTARLTQLQCFLDRIERHICRIIFFSDL
ncbi:MAG: hypothetical protein HEQ16_14695 [Bosea sp.]|nr:hypothetical protein [Bosea sp. (in: a-proteobacteria)]